MGATTRRSFLSGAGAALAGSVASSNMPEASSFQAETVSGDSARTRCAIAARQNIVMFMPDELRADALACYGNPVVKTPHFDALATQGTRFAQCQTAFPICGPARCSMLTGWPVSVRGHRSQMYFLRPEEPNLFRYLRQAGYDVFWFGKNDALAAECFDDSVTLWNYSQGRTIAEGDGSGRGGGAATGIGESTGDRRSTSDYKHLAAGIRILERKESDRPFCLFLPLLSPHPPYSAPEDFAIMYKPGSLPDLIPADLPNRPRYMARLRATTGLDKQPAELFRKMRASYLGKVSYADWLLGELMEALERTHHVKDTALLAFSDHGDYAGDYGLGEKWAGGLEECLTHVPLLVRVPGGARGHTVSNQTELFDVMQTSLELAGTTARHTHFSRSLLPQVLGGAGDADRAAFSESGYNVYEPQCFLLGGDGGGRAASAARPVAQAPPAEAHESGRLEINEPDLISRAACVKTHEYKLVSRPQGQSELYLYRDDPQELHNRFGEAGVRGTQMAAQQRLLDWYINTSGIAPWNRDQRSFPAFLPMPKGEHDARNILDRG